MFVCKHACCSALGSKIWCVGGKGKGRDIRLLRLAGPTVALSIKGQVFGVVLMAPLGEAVMKAVDFWTLMETYGASSYIASIMYSTPNVGLKVLTSFLLMIT